MTAYSGPATLVLPDGTEHQVILAARIEPGGAIRRWSGLCDADGQTLWDALNAATPAVLRLQDGREGRALFQADGSFSGSGPAPFE
ncbi:hypothetical protein HDA40_002041 [Hamadaea flava]|uniref:DUF4873 domain-containing protein n=1 Tax=Hamadaea flava TaxID=1742688 RepID=A0ABV8LJD8_9ACTN|nr:DUF4873 domain-containing protein [Hamadaea flava]MCP2323534.1 hypothetical protein [Hamadaea flava]